MTAWSDIARETVERVALTIPEGATLKERIKAIDAAYPFGSAHGAHWPRRAWQKARRAYLTRYGYRGAKEPPPLFAGWDRDPETGRPINR